MYKEKTGIGREEALELLKKYVKNKNMIKHCLASEIVMKTLAEHLDEDPIIWSMAGLLHDLDVEYVNNDLKTHTQVTEKILSDLNINKDIIDAIKMHNEEAWNVKRSKKFHHALAAGETITGLIIATTLVYPDKKIGSVRSKSIVKRMKEKAFAAKVNRDIIRECELINIPIKEFAEICLNAMKTIDKDLELD